MAATSMKLHQVLAMGTLALVCSISSALGEDTSSSGLADNGLPSSMRARSLADMTGCQWPFNNGTLTFQFCKTLDGNYTFNWNVSADGTVTVGFSSMRDGWIAWGISEAGKMVGSSAIIGFVSSTNVTVDGYYLAAKNPTGVKPPSKFTSVSNRMGEYVSGDLRILATVQLAVQQVTSTKLIWASGAYGSEGIERHTDVGVSSVNLLAGAITSLTNSTALAPTLGGATAPSPAKAPSSAAISNNRPFFASCVTAVLLVLTFAFL